MGACQRCRQNHTANGKTVPAVIVILRVDIRRVRIQVVTVCSRASSSRPPVAICDAFVDVAIRAIVVARTEKVIKVHTGAAMHERKSRPSTLNRRCEANRTQF